VIKFVFALVVLLFGSNAIADGNKWGASKWQSYGHESSAYKEGKSHGRWSGRTRGRSGVQRHLKQDSVCNVVRGGTRGLYGLCVTYCEAKGVDSLFTKYQFNPRRAKLASLDRETVLSRYNKRRRGSDPAMPCVEEVAPAVASCPCWTTQTVEVGNWQTRGVAAKCLNAINSDELEAGASGSDFAKILALNVDTATNYCVLVDETSNTEMMQLISEPDAATCRAQVKTTCEDLNLSG